MEEGDEASFAAGSDDLSAADVGIGGVGGRSASCRAVESPTTGDLTSSFAFEDSVGAGDFAKGVAGDRTDAGGSCEPVVRRTASVGWRPSSPFGIGVRGVR